MACRAENAFVKLFRAAVELCKGNLVCAGITKLDIQNTWHFFFTQLLYVLRLSLHLYLSLAAHIEKPKILRKFGLLPETILFLTATKMH